jgi:hypothetical protein
MAEALVVISILSTAASVVQKRKINKEQKKQNKLHNKIEAIKRRRGIKKQIAASRIQIAQQQSMGFNLGVSGSSSVAGAAAGVTSDTATSIGASNLQFTGQEFNAGFANNISDAQSSQATFGAISSIAGGLASNEQAVAGVEDFFGFGG